MNVYLSHLTDTLYSTGVHGIPPIATLSLISSRLDPKLDPSMATKVPPSMGPDNG